MKKKLLSLFTIILSACAIGFISTIGLFSRGVKAEETQVEFQMLGASLRLGLDYDTAEDTTGLRFAAQVDKGVAQEVLSNPNKTFGGVIVPANLLTADLETGRPAFKSSDNIFTYMETYNPGVSLAFKEDLTIGERTGYNVVALSLTNVANKNLARDFYGIIYIKNGSEYIFASAGVTKSVHYVATATVADTEAYLTDEQEAAATLIAKKAAYVAKVGRDNVNNNPDKNTDILYDVVKNETLSSYYRYEANQYNQTQLEYAYAKTGKVSYDVILNNEDDLVFNAYREYIVAAADRKYITVDQFTGEIFVTDGAFDGVAESSITVNVKMHVLDTVIDVPVTITNNVDTIAAEVTAKLSDAASITIENAYNGIALHAARYAYEELSAAGKRAVDASVLSAFEDKEVEYEQNFSIVSGPLNYSRTSYVGGSLVVNEAVEDETYGLVYEMKYSDQSGNGYVLIKLNTDAIFASGKKVYISMYNGGAEDAEVLYLKDSAYWTRPGIALPAGEWTEVEIDSGLLSGDTIGLAAPATTDVSFKFTMMYSKSDSYVANQVNAIIAALPETVTGLDGDAIYEARSLYETLSDSAKALVTNIAKLEAAEAAYAEKYQLVLAMNDASGLSSDINNFGDIADYEYAVDATYGNVLVGTVKAEGAAVVISAKAVGDLSLAKTVYIWVYKSGTDGRFNAHQGGNWNTMHSVSANTWTLISIPASEVKDFRFGFWDAKVGETVKFSYIWADTYLPEIADMEAQIAVLDGTDADAIVDAFDTFYAQPTVVQNATSNKDLLYSFVNIYNTTLINRAIDAINLIPASPAGNQYGLIYAAKDAYNRVPAALRGEVTNYSNIALAENAWKNNYEMLLATENDSRFEEFKNLSANYSGGVFTLSNEVVDNYGKVIKAEVSTQSIVVFSYNTTTNRAGLKSIIFTIYNGSTSASVLDYWGTGAASATGATLPANTWTTVEVMLDGYKGITTTTNDGYTTYTGRFGIWNAKPGTWYVASVYFTTYWGDVYAVEDMIAALDGSDVDAIEAAREAYDALPDSMKQYVSNLSVLEGYEAGLAGLRLQAAIDAIEAIPSVLEAKDIALIEYARDKYDSLDDGQKEQVTNINDLTTAEETYARYFVLGASASGFEDKTNGWLMGGAVTAGYETDPVFGTVYTATVNKITNQTLITTNTHAIADTKTYSKAVIYIYNGGNNHAKFHQFNGGWTILDITLYAGQWTKVEFNTADFDNTNLFLGAGGLTETGVTFKFSSMWLYTEEYLSEGINGAKVQEAIAAIDALPEDIKEYDKEKLDAARAVVEVVPVEMRDQISNLDQLEEKEATYAKYYLSVSAVTTYTDATANWIGGGHAQVATLYDDTYGTTYNLTYKVSNGRNGVALKFVENGTLADYGEFVVYIYNGGSTTANLLYVNGGGSWVVGQELSIGWNKVTLDATNIYSGRLLGICNGELDATYKFSALYAYTDTYKAEVENGENIAAAIVAIDTLPENIKEYDYEKIQAVKAVVESVPESLRNQITNLAEFEAAEDYYNTNFVFIANASGYKDITTGWIGGAITTGTEVDATYGTVYTSTLTTLSREGTIGFKMNATADLTDITEVVMYIYNGGEAPANAMKLTSSAWANLTVLTPGQWTKVVINITDITADRVIGAINVTETTAQFKFSSIYAYTDDYQDVLAQEAAQVAIDAINALPEDMDAYTYYDIQAVQAVIDSIPEEYRDRINNTSDFEAYKAQYDEKYVMIRAWNDTVGLANISSNYKAGTTQAYSVVEDETYGKVLKVEHAVENGGGAVWAIDYTALTTTIPSGWILTFTVYNGGSKAHPVDICQTGSVTGATYTSAPAGQWTEAQIVADNYKFYSATNGRFDVWEATTGTYYLAAIYAVNPSTLEGYAIQNAIDAIDAIPETLNGYDNGAIAYAQSLVDSLTEEGKNQVNNIAKLEAAIASYNNSYLSILPMVESSGISENSSSFGLTANYSFEADATYGQILVGNAYANGMAVVKYTAALPNMELCDYVYIWVYKSTAGNFSAREAGDWNNMHAIEADTWTLIQIPAADFNNAGFGFWGVKSGDVIKFSSIWATTTTEVINDAIAAIDTLPETIKEYHLDTIEAIRAVVNAVPESFRNETYITNLSVLEAAEAYYADRYIVISDETTFIDKTADMMGGGHAQVAITEDEDAGNVYSMTYVVENSYNGVMFRFANEGDLASYGMFALYIYNGGTTTANVAYVNGGGSWQVGAALPAGEWTRVEFDATNMYSGKVIGVRDGELNATYKFTSLYAYTDTYYLEQASDVIEEAEAVIDAIPETLEGYEYHYILNAEAAVAAVPAKFQSFITNLADLEAAKEYYNTYYIAVLLMNESSNLAQDLNVGGDKATYEYLVDETYGQVAVGTVHSAGAATLQTSKAVVDLSEAVNVNIWVYKTTAGRFNMHQGGNWNTMHTIAADTWTLFTISASEFADYRFGLWDSKVDDTIKFSMMWADKPAKVVQPVMAQIEELPDGYSEFDFVEINAAREAVNALPENCRTNEHITNLYKLENAEATYNSLYALVANAASYQDITSGWIGGSNTYGKAEDPDYGTVFTSILSTMNGDGRIAFRLSPSVAVTNFPAIAMYIYNGSMDDVNLMILTGGSSWDAYDVLPANQWTRVVMDTTKFGADPIMGLKFVKDTEAQFKFTNAFGLTEYGMALSSINAASEAVARTPSQINAYSYYELNDIKAVVDAVPETYRTSEYILGLADFQAAEAKYNESYIMVRAWDDMSGISNISANYKAGTTQTYSVIDDPTETYGKVLQVEHNADNAQDSAAVWAIEYAALTTDMSNATKLYFTVYNDGGKAAPFDICHGGSITGAGYGGNAPVGEWFTVSIDVANYTFRSATTGRIGVWNATTGSYYLAAIWAETATGAINRAIDAIDAIPEEITDQSAGLIAYAQSCFNELSAEHQEQVINKDKLTNALATFNTDYAIVANVDTYVYNANLGGSYANAEIVDDATYGKVFRFVKTSSGGVAFSFTPSVTIANYAKVYVAVRASVDCTFGGKISGAWNDSYKALEANVWTVIEIKASDLSSNCFGIWRGTADMTIEYSLVWASIYDIEQDVDQNDPF